MAKGEVNHPLTPCNHAFHLFVRLFESPSQKINSPRSRFLFRDDELQRSSVERAIVGMEGGISLFLSIEPRLLTSCSTFFIFLSDYSNLRVKKLAISPRINFSFVEENHETTSVNDYLSKEQ